MYFYFLRIVCVISFCVLTAYSQNNQEGVDRNDSRNAIAAVEGLDFGSVDLRTGGLRFHIPLGQAYPQRNGTRFQMSLNYSSRIYKYLNNPITREELENPPSPPHEPRLSEDRLAFFEWNQLMAHAGLGFTLNTGFGALRIDAGSGGSDFAKKATFFAPDGRSIFFYNQFKEDSVATPNVWFSRGGEYARMTFDPDQVTYTVELSNGTMHFFEWVDGKLRATEIRDRFNESNTLSIAYGEVDFAGSLYPLWTITDSENRHFTIEFGQKFLPYGEGEHDDNPDIHPVFINAPEFYLVTKVTVPTVGGNQSDYVFDYTTLTGFQPFNQSLRLNPIFFDEYHANLLETLTIPSGEIHLFDYYTTEVAHGHMAAIESYTNPFGGKVAWKYGTLYDPDNSGNGSFLSFDPYKGVMEEVFFDRDHTTQLAKTEFIYLLLDENGLFADSNGDGADREISYRRDRVTIRRDYETADSFNDQAFYFNSRNYPLNVSREDHRNFVDPLQIIISQESRFFQMPGTPHIVSRVFFPGEDDLNTAVFLTSRQFDGAYDAGTSLTSEFAAYENDVPLKQNGETRIGHDQLTNARAWINMTLYEDASNVRIAYSSDWSGFGTYRRQTVTTDFVALGNGGFRLDEGANLRTTYQHFLPGPESTSNPGSLTWILNLPSYREVWETASADVIKTEFAYNPNNGFLQRARQFKSLDGTQGKHDRLIENIPNANGRVTEIKVFGGDLKTLPVDPVTGLGDLDLSEKKPETRTKFTYLHGVAKQEEALYKNTGNRYLLLRDRNIDANTGRILKETVPDGSFVSFVYDELGRTIQENPQEGANAVTTYQIATATSAPKVIVKNKMGTAVLTESQSILDGWGNVVMQRTKHTDGQWSQKQFDYAQHPDGRLNRESTVYDQEANLAALEQDGQSIVTWTTSSYDALGRLESISFPDNTTKTYGFLGFQEVIETKLIGTGDQWTSESKTTQFDALGRIVLVSQGDDHDGSEAEACYSYNTRGDLVGVALESNALVGAAQTRSWSFDGIGNIISEIHPELSSAVDYKNYDSGGQVGLVEQSQNGTVVHRLRYTYGDPMRRLTQVWDGIQNRLLLEKFYAQKNLGNSRSAGKLYQVRRHNYVDIGRILGGEAGDKDVLVTRTYIYEGLNGVVSKLRIRATGSQHSDALSFEQEMTQTDLGNIDELTYPRLPQVLNHDVDLLLKYEYHEGNQALLKKISLEDATNPVKLVNYHASGMVKNLTYGNNVKKFIAIDSGNNLPRPQRISTGGVTDAVDGQPKNFDSGLFSYDGDGNITDVGDDYYTYDAVGRLTEAMVTDLQGVGHSFTYTYDRFGNMTSKDGFAISVDETKNRLTEPGFIYDVRGNVTHTDEVTYAYDPFNMVTTAEDVNGLQTYIYETTADGSDLRLLTIQADGSCQWTLRGLDNKVLRTYSGGTSSGIKAKKDNIFAGGLVATYEYLSSGTIKRQYTVSDHLGSIRMRTDGAGRLVRQYKYDPFGNDLPGSSTQDDDKLRFTEHERDNDHQTYMLTRYYNPKIARFNSVDAVLGTISEPQSWNRYAYVKNNPVKFVDPDGRAAALAIEPAAVGVAFLAVATVIAVDNLVRSDTFQDAVENTIDDLGLLISEMRKGERRRGKDRDNPYNEPDDKPEDSDDPDDLEPFEKKGPKVPNSDNRKDRLRDMRRDDPEDQFQQTEKFKGDPERNGRGGHRTMHDNRKSQQKANDHLRDQKNQRNLDNRKEKE